MISKLRAYKREAREAKNNFARVARQLGFDNANVFNDIEIQACIDEIRSLQRTREQNFREMSEIYEFSRDPTHESYLEGGCWFTEVKENIKRLHRRASGRDKERP